MTHREAVARAFLLALADAPTRLLPSTHRHARRTSERAVRRLRKLARPGMPPGSFLRSAQYR